MIIKINSRSEIPIYLQLRNQIVKGIGKGELEQGEILPTVRQMAADLGVNAMTVSKAYQLLKPKSAGWIRDSLYSSASTFLRKWRWCRNDSNDHYDIDGLADGGGYEVGLQLQSGLSSGNAIWCSCAG